MFVILLVIPGIVLVFSVLMKIAAGPYWLATNLDPAYLYLVNGVHLLKGVPINEATHPGTPLQLLCFAVGWLVNFGQPREVAVIHVLKSPEFYLHIVFIILLLLSFITSAALALYVYHKTRDRLAALLTQLPPLSYLSLKSWETPDPVHPIVANVSPEPMMMSMLNLFNLCFLMYFFAESKKDKFNAALIWGIVCGFSTAVKFTFLPLLLIPLILLSWKNKAFFISLFVVTFFIWTIPALSKYPLEWGYICSFITHKGAYQGGGGTGIIDLVSYLSNWKNIIMANWIFVAFLSVAFFLVLGKLVTRKSDKATVFLGVAMLGVIFQFSTVAKHPGAHYLLPGLGVFSSLLFLFYLQGVKGHRIGPSIVAVLILLTVIAGVWRAMEYRSNLEKLKIDLLGFYDRVHAQYKGFTFLGFYGATGVDSALRSGEGGGWYGEYQITDELLKAYPDSYFFNMDDRFNRIVNFKNERVLTNDLWAKSSGIIFQGDSFYPHLDRNLTKSPFTVQLLENGRMESIYLLTKTTEKQAYMTYLAAVHFYMAGDYKKALLFAIEAKSFHFQPENEVNGFIQTTAQLVVHDGQLNNMNLH